MNARFTPGPERFAETMADPTVLIDGDIAMVWGRYSFSIDGKLHHCGVDHFDLVREAGQWKIANLSWTRTTAAHHRLHRPIRKRPARRLPDGPSFNRSA
jgi:hypothetical protein